MEDYDNLMKLIAFAQELESDPDKRIGLLLVAGIAFKRKHPKGGIDEGYLDTFMAQLQSAQKAN